MESDSQKKLYAAVNHALKEAEIRFERVKSATQQEMDAEFLILPDRTSLLVEYHPGLAPRQLKYVIDRLRKTLGPNPRLGICVRRMTWSLLDAAKLAGVALFDLEGNTYLHIPGVHIERIRPGHESTPESTSGSVFTAKATRVVRAFLKRYPHDWRQMQLAKETKLSAGYVSTLTKRLVSQGYVSDRHGLLFLDDPERLLDDWVAHYRFDRHKKLSYAISANSYEEGVKKLRSELESSVSRFAWTGWTGAHLRAPYATPSIFMAYVSEAPEQMRRVFPVEKEGNVSLYLPHDEGVFQFTTTESSGTIVSDAQLYLDLRRMPGRAKEQADALRHVRLSFSKKTQ